MLDLAWQFFKNCKKNFKKKVPGDQWSPGISGLFLKVRTVLFIIWDFLFILSFIKIMSTPESIFNMGLGGES